MPEPIRQAAGELMSPGDALFFVDTDRGGEWWLLDERGGLVEAFWLE